MQILHNITVILPVLIPPALIMAVCFFLIARLWESKHWGRGSFCWTAGGIFLLLAAYWIWPWITYVPAPRVARSMLYDDLPGAKEALSKADLLIQFYAAMVSGFVGACAGKIAERYFAAR